MRLGARGAARHRSRPAGGARAPVGGEGRDAPRRVLLQGAVGRGVARLPPPDGRVGRVRGRTSRVHTPPGPAVGYLLSLEAPAMRSIVIIAALMLGTPGLHQDEPSIPKELQSPRVAPGAAADFLKTFEKSKDLSGRAEGRHAALILLEAMQDTRAYLGSPI